MRLTLVAVVVLALAATATLAEDTGCGCDLCPCDVAYVKPEIVPPKKCVCAPPPDCDGSSPCEEAPPCTCQPVKRRDPAEFSDFQTPEFKVDDPNAAKITMVHQLGVPDGSLALLEVDSAPASSSTASPTSAKPSGSPAPASSTTGVKSASAAPSVSPRPISQRPHHSRAVHRPSNSTATRSRHSLAHARAKKHPKYIYFRVFRGKRGGRRHQKKYHKMTGVEKIRHLLLEEHYFMDREKKSDEHQALEDRRERIISKAVDELRTRGNLQELEKGLQRQAAESTIKARNRLKRREYRDFFRSMIEQRRILIHLIRKEMRQDKEEKVAERDIKMKESRVKRATEHFNKRKAHSDEALSKRSHVDYPLQDMAPSKAENPLELFDDIDAFNVTYATPQFNVVGGLCYLSGTATLPAHTHKRLALLPPACRPMSRRVFDVQTEGMKTARIDILPNGMMAFIYDPQGEQWVTFDGIVFPVAGSQLGDLAVADAWTSFGGQYGSASVFTDMKVCVLDGVVKMRKLDLLNFRADLATVPDVCKPRDGMLAFKINQHNSSHHTDILTDGTVRWISGDVQRPWLSLDNIAYPIATTDGIALGQGWAAYGNGYRSPAVYTNKRVCYLSGVLQSPVGTGYSSVVGVLPATCRPADRLIFTVTSSLGPARFDVFPDGRVRWLDAVGIAPAAVLSASSSNQTSTPGSSLLQTGAKIRLSLAAASKAQDKASAQSKWWWNFRWIEQRIKANEHNAKVNEQNGKRASEQNVKRNEQNNKRAEQNNKAAQHAVEQGAKARAQEANAKWEHNQKAINERNQKQAQENAAKNEARQKSIAAQERANKANEHAGKEQLAKRQEAERKREQEANAKNEARAKSIAENRAKEQNAKNAEAHNKEVQREQAGKEAANKANEMHRKQVETEQRTKETANKARAEAENKRAEEARHRAEENEKSAAEARQKGTEHQSKESASKAAAELRQKAAFAESTAKEKAVKSAEELKQKQTFEQAHKNEENAKNREQGEKRAAQEHEAKERAKEQEAKRVAAEQKRKDEIHREEQAKRNALNARGKEQLEKEQKNEETAKATKAREIELTKQEHERKAAARRALEESRAKTERTDEQHRKAEDKEADSKEQARKRQSERKTDAERAEQDQKAEAQKLHAQEAQMKQMAEQLQKKNAEEAQEKQNRANNFEAEMEHTQKTMMAQIEQSTKGSNQALVESLTKRMNFDEQNKKRDRQQVEEQDQKKAMALQAAEEKAKQTEGSHSKAEQESKNAIEARDKRVMQEASLLQAEQKAKSVSTATARDAEKKRLEKERKAEAALLQKRAEEREKVGKRELQAEQDAKKTASESKQKEDAAKKKSEELTKLVSEEKSKADQLFSNFARKRDALQDSGLSEEHRKQLEKEFKEVETEYSAEKDKLARAESDEAKAKDVSRADERDYLKLKALADKMYSDIREQKNDIGNEAREKEDFKRTETQLRADKDKKFLSNVQVDLTNKLELANAKDDELEDQKDSILGRAHQQEAEIRKSETARIRDLQAKARQIKKNNSAADIKKRAAAAFSKLLAARDKQLKDVESSGQSDINAAQYSLNKLTSELRSALVRLDNVQRRAAFFASRRGQSYKIVKVGVPLGPELPNVTSIDADLPQDILTNPNALPKSFPDAWFSLDGIHFVLPEF